jgi:hypothetical protein
MSLYPRYFEPGQLQFLTTSTYRRNPLFPSDRFRWYFEEVLRELRPETGFLLIKPAAEQTNAFVPFNVYAERNRLQKLDYMHQNP